MHADLPENILMAPLDWGLGHATRCIPIIKAFRDKGISVCIACSGQQKSLLQKEFPNLEFFELPGYGIRLEKQDKRLFLSLILQVPKILKSIRAESAWVKEFCRVKKIDLIISDNRYGFYHPQIPSVFITHQLAIKSGLTAWADRLLLHWNYYFIRRFSECWVPDVEERDSLAGELSHPRRRPSIPLRYCGILSRFVSGGKNEETNPLLILISGPEPQRSHFETLIFSNLTKYPGKAVVVRGLPGTQGKAPLENPDIAIYNHCSSQELNHLLNISETVICRSGYSTVMDLARLQKKAILVPTPGQTEQEYLGSYLQQKKWVFTVRQRDFDLDRCRKIFREKVFCFPEFPDTPSMEQFTGEWLTRSLLRNSGRIEEQK